VKKGQNKLTPAILQNCGLQLCFKSDQLWSNGGKHGLSASTHWLLCQKRCMFVCSPSYFWFFGLCTLMGQCWMNPPPWVKFFFI
jgi:hypothetical protein